MNDSLLEDELQLLAESVRGWADRAGRQAPPRWQEFAQLGWLGVALPESEGGSGGGLLHACVLAEELGRAGVPLPFVASVVLGGMLLAELAPEDLRHAWLPALAEGRQRVAFAPWEPQCSDASRVAATARPEGDGWRLRGHKGLAPGLGGADGLLVAARTGEGRLGLFLLEAGATGLQLNEQRLYDGRDAATLAMQDAPARLLREGAEAGMRACIDAAMDRGLVAHCAETIGTLGAVFDLTREYLLARRQFGRAIAANQVVQHRLVDLYVEIEELRALWRAAAAAPNARLVAALAAQTTEVARHAWEETIQLHGAIGMTEEYRLGGHVRRLALAGSLYGDRHHHLARLAALTLGEEA